MNLLFLCSLFIHKSLGTSLHTTVLNYTTSQNQSFSLFSFSAFFFDSVNLSDNFNGRKNKISAVVLLTRPQNLMNLCSKRAAALSSAVAPGSGLAVQAESILCSQMTSAHERHLTITSPRKLQKQPATVSSALLCQLPFTSRHKQTRAACICEP